MIVALSLLFLGLLCMHDGGSLVFKLAVFFLPCTEIPLCLFLHDLVSSF